MTYTQFTEWAFLAVITGGVWVLYQMKESLNAISSKIEVMVMEHERARSDIDDHEDRIRDIEKTTYQN